MGEAPVGYGSHVGENERPPLGTLMLAAVRQPES